jgi:hypothetical protein
MVDQLVLVHDWHPCLFDSNDEPEPGFFATAM